MKDLYTVAEVARILGVSPASIYKRLNTSYKRYVTVDNGKKMLRKEILTDRGISGDDARLSSGVNDESTSLRALIASQEGTIADLRHSVQILEEQLTEKDKQITSLAQSLQAEQAINAISQKKHFLPFWKRKD